MDRRRITGPTLFPVSPLVIESVPLPPRASNDCENFASISSLVAAFQTFPASSSVIRKRVAIGNNDSSVSLRDLGVEALGQIRETRSGRRVGRVAIFQSLQAK